MGFVGASQGAKDHSTEHRYSTSTCIAPKRGNDETWSSSGEPYGGTSAGWRIASAGIGIKFGQSGVLMLSSRLKLPQQSFIEPKPSFLQE